MLWETSHFESSGLVKVIKQVDASWVNMDFNIAQYDYHAKVKSGQGIQVVTWGQQWFIS